MDSQTTIPIIPPKRRREIWPLAIVLTLVFFMSFIIGCVMLMMNNKSELISADYYQQELGYQNQINKTALVETLNKKVKYTVNGSANSMEIVFPSEKGREKSVSGTVKFIRPSDSRLDFNVKISLPESGVLTVPLKKVRPGVWTMEIDWKEGENAFFQTELLRI